MSPALGSELCLTSLLASCEALKSLRCAFGVRTACSASQSLLGGIHFRAGLPEGVLPCSWLIDLFMTLLTDMPWGSNMASLCFSWFCVSGINVLSLLQGQMVLLLNGYLPL